MRQTREWAGRGEWVLTRQGQGKHGQGKMRLNLNRIVAWVFYSTVSETQCNCIYSVYVGAVLFIVVRCFWNVAAPCLEQWRSRRWSP